MRVLAAGPGTLAAAARSLQATAMSRAQAATGPLLVGKEAGDRALKPPGRAKEPIERGRIQHMAGSRPDIGAPNAVISYE